MTGWQPDGAYLTMEQSAYMTRLAQGALFGWNPPTTA
jgi:hypothetical protein